MKYYVSDSRTLDTAGPMSIKEARDWLDEKCQFHGMDKGDWEHPEYWNGCEAPPMLYTESEWEELTEGGE